MTRAKVYHTPRFASGLFGPLRRGEVPQANNIKTRELVSQSQGVYGKRIRLQRLPLLGEL
ncbi:MAG TPA: hypothetical protein VFC63_22505 [Blastocatellia bacterium]|nr:hypothetical protein [Blastocatellia bacterium]